jgi:hypothetical protein
MYCWTVLATFAGPPKLHINYKNGLVLEIKIALPSISICNNRKAGINARDHLTGLQKFMRIISFEETSETTYFNEII